MRRLPSLLLSLLLALFLASLPSSAPAGPGFEAGIRGMYWLPDLSATAQTITAGVADTRFDVKDDLGVGDEDVFSGDVFLRYGRATLRLCYTPIRYDGNRTLAQVIVFSGRTFPVSDNVITRLDVDMLDAELQIDILRPDFIAASFSLGLLAKVKYVDGEVELAGSAFTEREEFQAPIPMVGIAVGSGLFRNFVRIDAKVAGLAYSGNHLIEADALASFVPFPFLRFQGGYRYIDLKVDEDDLIADLDLKGPYVGAQLSF